MILYRRILVTSGATIGVLLFLIAISASPAWAVAELKVDKRGPDTIEKGQIIAYQIDVTNPGSGNAKGVKLTDTVPDGTTYVSVSPVGDCGEDGGTVTCDLGNINVNRPAVAVTVQVRADGSKDTIKNTATATSNNTSKASDSVTTKLGSVSNDSSDTDNTTDTSDASAGGVKLTCEQLIKLSQGDGAGAAQYSIEVSQRCEGSANVIPGTVPDTTLADTGGPPLVPGALALGVVLIGSGLLLRASLRRER